MKFTNVLLLCICITRLLAMTDCNAQNLLTSSKLLYLPEHPAQIMLSRLVDEAPDISVDACNVPS